MSSQRFSEEFQRGLLVPSLRDEAFEHLSLVIDGPPEIVLHPVDFHEDLVEMPPPVTERTHRLNPTTADLGSENRPEPIPPEPHRLMRDVDAPLVQQVLDVAQRERTRDLHYHGQADDLR
jgi:hypothetical protein